MLIDSGSEDNVIESIVNQPGLVKVDLEVSAVMEWLVYKATQGTPEVFGLCNFFNEFLSRSITLTQLTSTKLCFKLLFAVVSPLEKKMPTVYILVQPVPSCQFIVEVNASFLALEPCSHNGMSQVPSTHAVFS